MWCCGSLAAQARDKKIFTEYNISKMNEKLQRVALCLDASVVNGVSAVYGEQQ